MGDPFSARSNHGQTLRNKFELEKRRLSYTDFHYEDVKSRLNTAASPSNQTRNVENKDEIIRHMSNLPSYLEKRKDTLDKALNFGVMDWGRLQKWQYQHLNRCSPSSSYSSPLFSTEGSTPQSTKSQTCSPAGQRPHRMTLQSHFNASSRLKNVNKLEDFYQPILQESESSIHTSNYKSNSACLKGKMKIQDPLYRTPDFHQFEMRKKMVYSPTVSHESSETDEKTRSYQDKAFEKKRWSFSSKNSGNLTASKPRSMSPIRRFSFSNTKTDNNTRFSTHSHSSPLRRLFEPLFQLKATNSRQVTESPRDDSNLDFRNETCESTSTRQALFQSAIKNGRPLFTFAIENNSNILAATVRDLSCSGNDNSNHWIYTFFTVDENKKKNGSWLSNIRKDKGHGYGFAPNVTAQMMVTNRSIYNSDTREFSLFRANPYDELAAIVVKFSRNLDDEEEHQERFSTTVILPGGNHGVSSDCKPSPLTDRWRSGGACDCGGWDLGCRLRTLTNHVQSGGRSNSPNGQFELFFQVHLISVLALILRYNCSTMPTLIIRDANL